MTFCCRTKRGKVVISVFVAIAGNVRLFLSKASILIIEQKIYIFAVILYSLKYFFVEMSFMCLLRPYYDDLVTIP